jgi:hypothetical protein
VEPYLHAHIYLHDVDGANLLVRFMFTVLLTQLAVVFSVLLVSSFAQYHHELSHYAPIPFQHNNDDQLEVEEYHHVSINP